MPTTIGRRSLPAPVLADNPDVPRDIGNLATALQDVSVLERGTLAARPTTGQILGDIYIAYDDTTMSANGTPYFWDTVAWRVWNGGHAARHAPGGADPVTGLNASSMTAAFAKDNVEPAFSSYRALDVGRSGWIPAGTSASTYVIRDPESNPNVNAANGNVSLLPVFPGAAFYLDPADFVAGSRVQKWRMRAECFVGATAPGVNITVDLRTVTAWSTVGGPQFTAGSLIAGTPVTFTAPAINTQAHLDVEITAPGSAGYYYFTTTPGNTTAASSLVVVRARLWVRNV